MRTKKDEILDIAQHLVQEKGLNGFSYIDLSKTVGIKTSSIHYYFPTKDDLAVALIQRYHQLFIANLESIASTSSSPKEKLILFSNIFTELVRNSHKICLCGMMAAEVSALSSGARQELDRYFQSCVLWLTEVFLELKVKDSSKEAYAFLCLLEGALLLARVQGKADMVKEAALQFLDRQ